MSSVEDELDRDRRPPGRAPTTPEEPAAAGITRRTALGAAAAGAVAVSLPQTAEAAKKSKVARSGRHVADVIVVGAGLAGIAAARDLVAGGASVAVLEAQNRVGGRAWSTKVGDGFAERGGEGLQQPHTQERIVAMAKDVGIECHQKVNSGNNVYWRKGKRTTYDRHGLLGRIPPDIQALVSAAPAVNLLELMALEIPPDAPWTHKSAPAWDSETLDSFLRRTTLDENGRFFVSLSVQIFQAALPRDISLLSILALTARFETKPTPPRTKLQEMLETTGTWRFSSGVQDICTRHAERLGMGDRVFLESPVRRIEQDGDGVRVLTDDMTVAGKRVIVALPPAVTRAIDYAPQLPPPRAMLLQRFPMGSAIKSHAIYDKPFWRDDGLTGEVFSDLAPTVFCTDESPEGGPGILYAYAAGHDARMLVQRSAEERRKMVLDNLAAFFGPRALQPTDYFDTPWASDPWTRGGSAAITFPGALIDFGPAINEPFGRIHWSGAEAALRWTGSLEGAVMAGEASAKEVLDAL